MDLQTISQVSRTFHISTRTLRYYDQIGLLNSTKKEEYAYRTYDEASIQRLWRILVLRKLRIPLKDISRILQNEDAKIALEVFQKSLKDVEEEITSLSAIQVILNTFIDRLKQSSEIKVDIDRISDESMRNIAESLTVTKNHFKEEKLVEISSNTKLSDVRIVYLPPSPVMSCHYIGDNPEEQTAVPLDRFVNETELYRMKPDLRQYGFNNPDPSGNQPYGYERCVTIPEDLRIPKPFIKKFLKGGLYAAHMIPIGAFEEWNWLYEWVEQSEKYELNLDDSECMGGCLEEHLNYVNYVHRPAGTPYDLQLDLLIPIKEKA